MTTIPIDSILVTARQRQDLGDLDRDFVSIREVGLIQPIVLEQGIFDIGTIYQYRLMVGGRRLAWLKANGFTELFHGTSCDPQRPGYILSSEVTERARQEAELYENLKRHNLNWREEVVAIARIHRQRWIESKDIDWGQIHTAHLLNLEGRAKVGYALLIADELRDNPTGDVSKAENFAEAQRIMILRSQMEGQKEQEKRRAIMQSIQDRLDQEKGDLTPEQRDAIVTEETTKQERETVWLSNLLKFGDFTRIAEDEYPPDTYPCAIINGDISDEAAAQVIRLLKADSFLIWLKRKTITSSLLEINWTPIIWNVLGLKNEDPFVPFLPNARSILIGFKGRPRSPNPSPTQVVSANEDGDWPPVAVLDFILKATTIPGETILMPTGGPVDRILELGRRPLCFETSEAKHNLNMEQAKAYYNSLYVDNVDFK